jgi:hypothetical protein
LRACLRDGLELEELPRRSVRTTPTAAMTNSHRTARKPSLMSVSVSAVIGVLPSAVRWLPGPSF